MAYEKQTWTNGDLITAEKLNHIEDGIAQGGGGVLTVIETVTEDAHGNEVRTLDKTYNEIASADAVRIKSVGSKGLTVFYTINGMAENDEQHLYYVSAMLITNDVGDGNNQYDYFADSADGVLSTQHNE